MVQTKHAPTLEELRANREEIIRAAEANGAANVRIFGSVARGEADAASDIDMLIDMVADVHGLAYFGALEDLRHALEELLGREVDVVDSAALHRMKDNVLRDAVLL